MTIDGSSLLKTLGYAVSAVSVMLLGIVSWKSASEQPMLFLCLLAGVAASIAGMVLRWISHRMDSKQRQGVVGRLADRPASAGTKGDDSSARNLRRPASGLPGRRR
jgi:hypothetical protein